MCVCMSVCMCVCVRDVVHYSIQIALDLMDCQSIAQLSLLLCKIMFLQDPTMSEWMFEIAALHR